MIVSRFTIEQKDAEIERLREIIASYVEAVHEESLTGALIKAKRECKQKDAEIERFCQSDAEWSDKCADLQTLLKQAEDTAKFYAANRQWEWDLDCPNIYTNGDPAKKACTFLEELKKYRERAE